MHHRRCARLVSTLALSLLLWSGNSHARRGRPPLLQDGIDPNAKPSTWLYGDAANGCSEETKLCIGTDFTCAALDEAEARERCRTGGFSRPFMTPNSEACPDGLLFLSAGDADERCIGTEGWCKKGELRYASEKECLGLRQFPPAGSQDWFHATGDMCFPFTERCLGTEGFCSQINDLDRRQQCLQARKATFFAPRSPECRNLGQLESTEPCRGTELWCKDDWREDVYGSEQSCLDLRAKQPPPVSVPGSQKPWRQRNRDKCGDCDPDQPLACSSSVDAEECMGTDRFCGSPDNQRSTIECLRERGKAPFFQPYSDECRYFQLRVGREANGEPCLGTASWCNDTETVELYGSRETCLQFRGERPARLPWRYVNADDCSDRDKEQCVGTESACSMNCMGGDGACVGGPPSVQWRQDCLAAREAPAFLLPDSEGCPGPGSDHERCVGSDEWCLKKHQQLGYADENSCFTTRGFDQLALNNAVLDSLPGKLKAAMVEWGANVTRNAMLRVLVHDHGDARQSRKAAGVELAAFFDKVKGVAHEAGKKGVERAVEKMR